jgi:negative regulator of sigma-B (phosphoserine phosphatase)
MSKPLHEEQCVIEWGSAGTPFEGGESGDAHVVVSLPNGALVGVIDGLGHGPEAAAAAQVAVETLRAHADEPVSLLVQRCHESMRMTRGAVMSLASFNATDSSVSLIGVGNVEGVLLRGFHPADKKETIALRGGVVGYQLPSLRAETVPVSPGDTLIMATDGIRSGFTGGLAMEREPQRIAESILSAYFKGSDDALVFVARYLGKPQ